jgi:hypothetical protein
MNYTCDWYAPLLAERNSMTGSITSQTLLIAAGGVQGLGFAPLLPNGERITQALSLCPIIFFC